MMNLVMIFTNDINLKYNYDQKNDLVPVFMGSYGIGIERIIASVVEQNNDEKGIIWPMNIAPYKVAIVVANIKDELSTSKALELYNNLNSLLIDTILDDRNVTIGVKFNDMDLIGIPIRITIGRDISKDLVEFKLRSEKDTKNVKYDELIQEIKKYVNK